MKTIAKFSRLALGASLGSFLWAGCSSDSSSFSRVENPGIYATSPFASAPVDQTKRRPDTHPENRSGLWRVTSGSHVTGGPSVIEAPAIQTGLPGADSTSLLALNPEAVNAAIASTGDGAIVEAAGARVDDRNEIILQDPSKSTDGNTRNNNQDLEIKKDGSGVEIRQDETRINIDNKARKTDVEIKSETETKTKIEVK